MKNPFVIALRDGLADCVFASLRALPCHVTLTAKQAARLLPYQTSLSFACNYTQKALQMVRSTSQSSPFHLNPPTIAHRLSSATERVGTRTSSLGLGDKEDTSEIVTLPARVTFQPGTTARCIFVKHSVLMDLQPGIISDFLLSVFHTNPTLVNRLDDVDIEKVHAAVDPYISKGKHDKSDTRYYVGQGDGDTLLFASGKPTPSETQARGFTKTQLVYQECVLPAKDKKWYPVQSPPTWSPIAF